MNRNRRNAIMQNNARASCVAEEREPNSDAYAKWCLMLSKGIERECNDAEITRGYR
jgi:hypothetical protein